MIALGMFLGQAYVLIHVERDNIGKRHLARLVKRNQLLIHAQRRRTRRQTQNERFVADGSLGIDTGDDMLRSPTACLGGRILYDQSHNLPLFL